MRVKDFVYLYMLVFSHGSSRLNNATWNMFYGSHCFWSSCN